MIKIEREIANLPAPTDKVVPVRVLCRGIVERQAFPVAPQHGLNVSRGKQAKFRRGCPHHNRRAKARGHSESRLRLIVGRRLVLATADYEKGEGQSGHKRSREPWKWRGGNVSHSATS